MNIPKVTALFSKEQQYQNNNKNSAMYSHYGVKMSSPLNVDTVSFGAKGRRGLQKTGEEVARQISGGTNKTSNWGNSGATKQLAMKVGEIASIRHPKVRFIIESLLKDLVATEQNPKRPILKLCYRPKSDGSIHGKSFAREWNSKNEIVDKMEDINGAKIVMNYGTTKADVDRILDRFIPSIQSGVLELLEVENKRPIAVYDLLEKDACEYDYSSIKKLEDMMDIQLQEWSSKRKNKKYLGMIERLESCKGDALKDSMTPGSNYTALHFIFRLPKTNTKFELQIMGPEVERVKSVDDVVWKYLHNKNAPDIYDKSIGTNIRSLTEAGKSIFNDYRAALFLSQREKELIYAEGNGWAKKKIDKNFLLVNKYGLPPQYDYNNIFLDIEKSKRLAEDAKNVAKDS